MGQNWICPPKNGDRRQIHGMARKCRPAWVLNLPLTIYVHQLFSAAQRQFRCKILDTSVGGPMLSSSRLEVRRGKIQLCCAMPDLRACLRSQPRRSRLATPAVSCLLTRRRWKHPLKKLRKIRRSPRNTTSSTSFSSGIGHGFNLPTRWKREFELGPLALALRSIHQDYPRRCRERLRQPSRSLSAIPTQKFPSPSKS